MKTARIQDLANLDLIDRHTYLNKDKSKGYRKTYIALIKDMYLKGYFTKEPQNEEIILLLKNTFNVETKIDNCKKTNISYLLPKYKKIEYANLIKT